MTILGRYVAGRFLSALGGALAAGTSLYLIIDFFDRVRDFARYDPEFSAILSYFLYKIPGVIYQLYPAASLLAVLLSIGILSRNREIMAIRACGVSTWKLATPVIVLAAFGSVLAFLWNETVVPPASAMSNYVNDVVIKNKPYRGIFNASSLWFQSSDGFVNIDYYDASQRTIYGLTLYDADKSFHLNRMIEIPTLKWRDQGWEAAPGTVKTLEADGLISSRPLEQGEFSLAEAPEDLAARRRKPSEFSFRQLKTQTDLLKAKGLGADDLMVDLHNKLAWPVSGLITVLVGFPLAVRGGRRGGMGYSLGTGMAVGFGYWVVAALALSAGRTGGLPAPLAAWSANILFSLLAAGLYTASHD